MINPDEFVEVFIRRGINRFVGVPDSLLKNLNTYFYTNADVQHQIAVNEGSALGIAIGNYLASKNPSVVYLQNSGFGNLINPLLTLADQEIYGIPMIIIIGWRGQPGEKDEPQHIKQGQVLISMIEAMRYDFEILPKSTSEAIPVVESLISKAIDESKPVFLIVEKDTFAPPNQEIKSVSIDYELSREEALILVLSRVKKESAVFSTTGMLSREMYELRRQFNYCENLDFLTIGGMGHTSSISYGFSQIHKNIDTWCLDGDGSLLMHMGVLATIGKKSPENFKHIIFNNGVHDSVGGQPTDIDKVNVSELFQSMGYKLVLKVFDKKQLIEALDSMENCRGPILLEIMIKPGNRSDLGRPEESPKELLQKFMKNLSLTIETN